MLEAVAVSRQLAYFSLCTAWYKRGYNGKHIQAHLAQTPTDLHFSTVTLERPQTRNPRLLVAVNTRHLKQPGIPKHPCPSPTKLHNLVAMRSHWESQTRP